MNKTELINARKEYRAKIKDNERLIEIKKELEHLKQNKDVLRYIALSKYELIPVKNKDEILYITFEKFGRSTKDSPNIYVFMGSYLYDYSSDVNGSNKELKYPKISSIKNASWISYNEYWNLETLKCHQIAKKDIKAFEDNNIVIYNDNSLISLTPIEYQNFFYNLQEEYYKLLTITTQEKAIVRLKKRHKIS